jgi:hypothetical protein
VAEAEVTVQSAAARAAETVAALVEVLKAGGATAEVRLEAVMREVVACREAAPAAVRSAAVGRRVATAGL